MLHASGICPQHLHSIHLPLLPSPRSLWLVIKIANRLHPRCYAPLLWSSICSPFHKPHKWVTSCFIPELEVKLLSMASDLNIAYFTGRTIYDIYDCGRGGEHRGNPGSVHRALAGWLHALPDLRLSGTLSRETLVSPPPLFKHMMFYQQGSLADLEIM